LLALGRAEVRFEMSLAEGTEYRLEENEKEVWESLILGRGEVLEVHLPSTNLECGGDLWASFWVKRQTGTHVGPRRLYGRSEKYGVLRSRLDTIPVRSVQPKTSVHPVPAHRPPISLCMLPD